MCDSPLFEKCERHFPQCASESSQLRLYIRLKSLPNQNFLFPLQLNFYELFIKYLFKLHMYKKYQKIEEMSCKNRSKKKYFTLWSSSGRILKVSFQCYHSFSPYTQPYIPSRDDMNGVLKQHQPFQKNTEVLDLLVSWFCHFYKYAISTN